MIRLRRCLLKAVDEFRRGQAPHLADNPALDYRKAISVGGVVADGADWRRLLPAD